MSRRDDLIKIGRRAHWGMGLYKRDPDLANEISRAVFLADLFTSWRELEKHCVIHKLAHCPVCDREDMPWPSRATRGDLL